MPYGSSRPCWLAAAGSKPVIGSRYGERGWLDESSPGSDFKRRRSRSLAARLSFSANGFQVSSATVAEGAVATTVARMPNVRALAIRLRSGLKHRGRLDLSLCTLVLPANFNARKRFRYFALLGFEVNREHVKAGITDGCDRGEDHQKTEKARHGYGCRFALRGLEECSGAARISDRWRVSELSVSRAVPMISQCFARGSATAFSPIADIRRQRGVSMADSASREHML